MKQRSLKPILVLGSGKDNNSLICSFVRCLTSLVLGTLTLATEHMLAMYCAYLLSCLIQYLQNDFKAAMRKLIVVAVLPFFFKKAIHSSAYFTSNCSKPSFKKDMAFSFSR